MILFTLSTENKMQYYREQNSQFFNNLKCVHFTISSVFDLVLVLRIIKRIWNFIWLFYKLLCTRFHNNSFCLFVYFHFISFNVEIYVFISFHNINANMASVVVVVVSWEWKFKMYCNKFVNVLWYFSSNQERNSIRTDTISVLRLNFYIYYNDGINARQPPNLVSILMGCELLCPFCRFNGMFNWEIIRKRFTNGLT